MARALFFTDALTGSVSESEAVHCELCPNFCKIANGYFGACGVRGNKGGKGIIPFYGFVSAFALDPIEKKPLYHFKSGSVILSLGFAGCNLRCPFCQNWRISQNTDIPGKYMKPGEIVSAALKHNSPSIAYTYSEPLVHIEFLLDCMTLARKHGLANVLVTNGCINSVSAFRHEGIEANPAAKILSLTDAVNVDLKTFSAQTYKEILGGGNSSNNALQAVMDFIKLAFSMNVHLEVTTLVVPNLNDSPKELFEIADFLASINKEIPWHLTAYHPDFRWNAPPTDPAFLKATAKKAREILHHVHTGNIC